MKVAAIQMVSGASVEANLRAARSLLDEAAAAGAQLAVLPEDFCFMGRRDADTLAVGEPFGDGPVQSFLRDTASQLRLAVVGGTVPLKARDDAHVYNTCLAYSASGERLARYDKIHLYQYDNGRKRYEEGRTVAAGAEPVAFTLSGGEGHVWRIGLSVCYDLRFPELYRRLGADVLLVPSAFALGTGEAHWATLLRARAIENLAYVIAPAQGGNHENGRRTWGHTMVVDPWGVLVAERATGAGVVLAELDAARVAQVRSQLPALAHRVL